MNVSRRSRVWLRMRGVYMSAQLPRLAAVLPPTLTMGESARAAIRV